VIVWLLVSHSSIVVALLSRSNDGYKYYYYDDDDHDTVNSKNESANAIENCSLHTYSYSYNYNFNDEVYRTFAQEPTQTPRQAENNSSVGVIQQSINYCVSCMAPRGLS